MSQTKKQEVYDFIRRKAKQAISIHSVEISDRAVAETIRANRSNLAEVIALEIAEEYSFLELVDIMEWKRSRVRR